MVAIALYAADPTALRHLEHLTRGQAGVAVVGRVGSVAALTRLLAEKHPEVVLADGIPDGLAQRAAFVVIVGDPTADDAIDKLLAGAQSVLPRGATGVEVAAAIAAAAHGLALLPRTLLQTLLRAEQPDRAGVDGDEALLTARELEVLAAMADGASNKAIARRLGISFHTVKFHVAAILAKLDAESRTEAVARGARLGLVML
jgi:DNA-binding NarL/FixJ family response regulator